MRLLLLLLVSGLASREAINLEALNAFKFADGADEGSGYRRGWALEIEGVDALGAMRRVYTVVFGLETKREVESFWSKRTEDRLRGDRDVERG